MRKSFLIWGLSFGLTAVIFGALGAHALKPLLNNAQLSSFETGLRFQMYHAILLIVLSLLPSIANKTCLYLLVLGTLFFSFSIYLLSIQELINLGNLKFLGPITPIGGMLLIFGWGSLLVNTLKLKVQ